MKKEYKNISRIYYYQIKIEMSMFMYYIVRRHFSGLGHPDFNRSSVSVLPPVWFKALRNAVTVQRRTIQAMRRMCITEKGGR